MKFISKNLLTIALLLSTYTVVRPTEATQPVVEAQLESAAQYWVKNKDVIRDTAPEAQVAKVAEVSSSMMQSALQSIKAGLAYLISMPTANQDAYLCGYATVDTAYNVAAKAAVVAALYGAYKLYQKITQQVEEDFKKASSAPEKLRPAPVRLV